MNTLKVAILLIVSSVVTILAAADPADPVAPEDPITLEAIRELGRENSRFLNENDTAAKPTNTIPKANLAHFQKSVGPLLAKNCLACHGPQRSEGRLRIDELNPNLLSGLDIEQWREIYNALSNSEMPPEGDPDFALTNANRSNIVEWLSAELNKAFAATTKSTRPFAD